MVEQLKTFDDNRLAIEIIDGYTQADESFCEKLFKQKSDAGKKPINILVKLDEMKITNSDIKAFFEDGIYIIRRFTDMGHIAVVAHSKVLKALVPIDNLFFERSSKGRHERYFDISKIDEAYDFINT